MSQSKMRGSNTLRRTIPAMNQLNGRTLRYSVWLPLLFSYILTHALRTEMFIARYMVDS